ncbi:MAG: tetratricopeptide repeat protein [Planctomycetes bacterium]|nr:tetratricopeptide repeat protein [Planctomycetota bacterium]
MQRVTPSLLIAFAVLAPQAALAQLDQVFGSRGTATRGSIIGTSPAEITLQSGGSEQKFPVNEVRRVTFDGEPNELGRARQAVQAGQLEQALDDLKKIDIGQIQRDIVKQDAQYYMALAQAKLALARGGDKTKAAQDMMAFYRANPGSHHHFETAEILGDLAMGLDNPAAAKPFYDELAKAPWPEYKMKAFVLGADALMAQGDYEGALKAFETVIGANIDTPEASRQKVLSRVGKAESLANTGKTDEAVQICEQIIADNPSTDMELFGRAYNALGVAHLKADRPQQAALAFLHVDTLFFGDPDQHAQALYYLSDLWTQMNQADRALEARTKLKNFYSGTRWARMKS